MFLGLRINHGPKWCACICSIFLPYMYDPTRVSGCGASYNDMSDIVRCKSIMVSECWWKGWKKASARRFTVISPAYVVLNVDWYSICIAVSVNGRIWYFTSSAFIHVCLSGRELLRSNTHCIWPWTGRRWRCIQLIYDRLIEQQTPRRHGPKKSSFVLLPPMRLNVQYSA